MAQANASVKMSVTGVAQFKQSINTAKQQIKTMDADLALLEKQFKQSGDAETYMQSKTELLKAKMEEQKIVLQQAEDALQKLKDNGVSPASKAFQEMQREIITAKGNLIDTENQLNGVADAGDKAGDGVSEMNAQLSRIGKSVDLDKVARGVETITDNLEKAAKKALDLGKKIVNTMISAGSWADDLHTRAQYFGLTDEELQRMEKTATLIDTPVEAIINAKKKLKAERAKEGKNDMGAWAALGINPADAKNADDLFWRTGQALMKLGDEYDKEAYAQELFGRSWSELIPLFTAGREEYEKTKASWKVVGQESIDALGKMDDEYQRLMADWETFKYEALSEFAEPMRIAFEAARDALGRFMEYLKSEDGQKMIDNIVSNLRGAIEWISKPENIQKAIDGLKAIVIGWGGLQLVGGGLQVLNLINGAKNLFGGGADKVTSGGGAAVAASGGGGLLTGTAAGAKLAGLMSGAQIFSSVNGGPIVDWAMNNSPWATLFNGTENFDQWWNRMVSEQKQRIDTFGEDWANNNLVKFFTDRNDNADAASRLATGADWRPSYMGGGSAQEAVEKMTETAEDLTGATDAQQKSATDLKNAADNMQNVPAETAKAVYDAINGMEVKMDGQAVGWVTLPYLEYLMGQRVVNE